MSESVSRKVALERLSTPEHLDLPMQVLRPADWLIFVPLALLLVLACAWGWFGAIPSKVSGKCILINPTGLVDVAAAASGTLTALSVQVGDGVQRGQAVGTVALPELAERIEMARAKLAELEAERQRVRQFASRGQQLSNEALAQQRQILLAQQRGAEERVRLMRERLDAQAQLLAQGLITQLAWINARQELNAAQGELGTLTSQLAQLGLKRLESDKQAAAELATIDAQIDERRRQLDALVRNRSATSVIESPFSGRVVEVKAGVGTTVAAGGPVLSLEPDSEGGQPLEAAIFVPAGDGKRIELAMPAQVTPATVKREEHGYLLAQVRYVAEYPSSLQRMQMLLQNEVVVKDLAGSSPPIEVRATLQPARNASGFAWSSAKGAPLRIRGGTLCQADIVVATQRPASLVLPVLKKTLGVD